MSSRERQYRPINYAASVPPLKSTTDSEKRQIRRLPSSPDGNNPYYRRRTADNFPQPKPAHVAPAITRSKLPVSASTNDLSKRQHRLFLSKSTILYQSLLTPMSLGKQTPQLSRPRFPLINKFTPTRIPSPVWKATSKDRHVSTPVLPSQKTHKEVSAHSSFPTNRSLHIYQRETFT
jgi:hypothetical protein